MRRRLLGTPLLLVALSALGCAPGDGPPSILLITLDTTRQDALTCYGAPPGLTPNLDRLAAQGITYLEARTVAPITLPAHASMLTGLWPPRHGLRINGVSRLPGEAETLAELAGARGFDTAAFLSATVLDDTYALDQGFDVYDMVDEREREASNDFGRRPAQATVDAALAWFDARDASRPFLCWLHLFDPHGPWPESSVFMPVARSNPYLAQVAGMDREIGRLIERLESAGLLERTLVLVVGDHGESLGERGEFAHGVNCYDATLRVPFLVRHPDGRRAGERSDENVSVVDVFATVCEAIDAPAGDADGESLLSRPVPAERGVYFESLYGYANFGWSPLVGWIQDGNKYVHSPEPELYVLAPDPEELHNRLGRADADPVDPVDPEDPEHPGDPDVSAWIEALRETLARPRLAGDPPARMSEDLIRGLTALGYAFAGPVEEAPDPLAPSGRPSPHAARAEYARIQEAFELFDDSARAEAAWAAVLELNPENRTALAEHGYHLMQLERWSEAAAHYRELVRGTAQRSMHWVALGVCTEQMGDPAGAILQLRRGLELDPRNPAAREEFLRAMRAAGREDEARRELDAAGVD